MLRFLLVAAVAGLAAGAPCRSLWHPPSPCGSYFSGECTIDLLVPDTSQRERFEGTLTIGDLNTGVYKTFRVTARAH